MQEKLLLNLLKICFNHIDESWKSIRNPRKYYVLQRKKLVNYENQEIFDYLIHSIFKGCIRISGVSLALKVLGWRVFVKYGGNRKLNCSFREERQEDDWELWVNPFSFYKLKEIGNEDRFYSGSSCILFWESMGFTKFWIGFGVLCICRNFGDWVDVTGVISGAKNAAVCTVWAWKSLRFNEKTGRRS